MKGWRGERAKRNEHTLRSESDRALRRLSKSGRGGLEGLARKPLQLRAEGTPMKVRHRVSLSSIRAKEIYYYVLVVVLPNNGD